MKGSYRDYMQDAVDRSRRLEAACSETNTMAEWLASPQDTFRSREMWDYFVKMSRVMPAPPEIRANACAPFHLEILYMLLRQRWDNIPVVTIGDVSWQGDWCFGATEDSLKQAIDAGPSLDEIRMHAWLTFPDLSIVDFTFQPWLRVQNGEWMDLDEEGGLCLFGDPDAFRPSYIYKPLLVGPEFIWRTGSVGDFGHAAYDRFRAEYAASRA